MQIHRTEEAGIARTYIWNSGTFIPSLAYVVTITPHACVSIAAPSLRNADLDDVQVVINLLEECQREAERLLDSITHLKNSTASPSSDPHAEHQLSDYVVQPTSKSFCGRCSKPVDLLARIDLEEGPAFYLCWVCQSVRQVGIAPVLRIT